MSKALPEESERTRMKKRYIAGGFIAAAVIVGVATSGEGEGGDPKETAQPATSASAAADAKADDKPEPSAVEAFQAYVKKNGTANEKNAVSHVTKVQGADGNNDILDTADVYTDFEGDLMDADATGSAKLIASAFADFQESRGKDSENGLVTVYNASGSVLGNGKY